MAALTFDLWDELPGSGERLHSVEERVHADDLPQDTQNLPQKLMGQRTPILLFVCKKQTKNKNIRLSSAENEHMDYSHTSSFHFSPRLLI